MTGAYEAVRQLFGDDDLRAFGLSPTESRRAQDLPDNAANAVMLLELERYLADQLLPDTDSVSMAHSLEVRVPLLDDVVLATALAIPGAMRKSAGKQLLARATGLDRSSTKRTFTPPFATWIQGPLRDTVRGGLCSDELPFSDLIPSAMRQALWSQVEQGKGHWSRAWAVTVLRMWPAANGFRWD
jgi:asparagine synthase (glutamine-hydrolysing)